MRRIVLVALLLASATSLAQAQRELSLSQAVQQPFIFVPRAPQPLSWYPDSSGVTILARMAEGPGLAKIDPASGERQVVFMNAALVEAAKEAKLDGVNLNAFSDATFTATGQKLRFVHEGGVYHLDPATLTFERLVSFDASAEAQAFNADDSAAAYSKDKDVFVTKPDGTTHRVTKEGQEFLTHGLSVSRVEFGIKDGLWWSPDGKKLAFYREDLQPIEAYPYIDWEKRPAVHRLGRYPMAGRPASVVTIGVYDMTDDSLIWLDTDPEVDQFLTNVTWGPKSDSLFVAHVNRHQNEMDLRSYSAKDGKHLQTLFKESDAEWTEPEHGPIFLDDQSGDFLWFSPRDGFNHLYLVKSTGEIMQQVTTGKFDIGSFDGFRPDGSAIVVTASGANPLEQHLFTAALAPAGFRKSFKKGTEAYVAEGGMKQLTRGRGVHNAKLSPDGRYLLDAHSNLDLPLSVEIIDLESGETQSIENARNPWQTFQGGREEFFTVKAEDGSDLHGHMVLPPKFEEGKKYPVLLYVYGGPHSQLVKDEFLGGASYQGPWYHYMATQGIVVVRIDGHGTLNRGIDFQQAIHRRMGTLEVQDQLAGLEHVLSQPWADRDRVGVHGWSYGGFMTLSLMTRAGDHFKCGISGAPVTDWAFYETGYGERYMDTPEENPEGYEESRPASHLDGLKGRLLVVQGSSDDTVVWQHTMDFIDSCVKADKPVEYMVYPGQLHGLRGPYRWHFYQKMTKFFLDELKN